MLLQASIEIANAERWALEIGDVPAPASLQQSLRRNAYEVTVVDVLHRVARRYFEQLGYRAVWERPFRTGGRGRPETVDICLFSDEDQQELRLELGLYSKSKLRDDAKKLAKLSDNWLDDYRHVENLVLLWEVDEENLTRATSRDAMASYRVDSTEVFGHDEPHVVMPLLSSAIDLFVARSGASRRATVGLFEVRPR